MANVKKWMIGRREVCGVALWDSQSSPRLLHGSQELKPVAHRAGTDLQRRVDKRLYHASNPEFISNRSDVSATVYDSQPKRKMMEHRKYLPCSSAAFLLNTSVTSMQEIRRK